MSATRPIKPDAFRVSTTTDRSATDRITRTATSVAHANSYAKPNTAGFVAVANATTTPLPPTMSTRVTQTVFSFQRTGHATVAEATDCIGDNP